MIINNPLLQKFNQKLIKKEKTDFKKNLRLLNALYKQARTLGVFPLKDPLDGLDTDIKIAKVVNSV